VALQVDGPAGAHRNSRSGGRARRWWAVTVLAVAVAATSIVVPALVSPGNLRDRAAAGQATAPGPSASQPPAPAGTAPPASRTSIASPTPPAFQTVRIAATDPANERYGVAVIACPTCASGSRVQYLGQTHALVVHVRDIPVAGRRTLTIVYETQGTRPLDVIVNGGTTISLHLPGKNSWTTPAEVRVPVDLPAGPTIIRLFHNTQPAPDLDQIVIS
jgi:hypothetical protein